MPSLHIARANAQNLRWPSSCAVCCGPADGKAITSLSTSANFRYYAVLLKWTKHTMSLAFPACRKHAFLCRLLDIPARLGVIHAFLYSIFFPTVLWVASGILIALATGLKGDALSAYITWLAVLFYGSAALLLVAGSMFKPVTFSASDENSLTISIRSKQYFQAFEALNSSS